MHPPLGDILSCCFCAVLAQDQEPCPEVCREPNFSQLLFYYSANNVPGAHSYAQRPPTRVGGNGLEPRGGQLRVHAGTRQRPVPRAMESSPAKAVTKETRGQALRWLPYASLRQSALSSHQRTPGEQALPCTAMCLPEPVPSAVALSRLSPGRRHKQHLEDGDARVARGNGRLSRTSWSVSTPQSQLAFGSYRGKGSESPSSKAPLLPRSAGQAPGPIIPGLGVEATTVP